MFSVQITHALQLLSVAAIPVLFAITVHEAAHGWVASRLGDRTAQMLGRVSLNPAKHIDPIGTVVVPILMSITSGFIFGWAKPVPVNTRNLRNPKRDMILVAFAGPSANLLMALGWVLFFHLVTMLSVVLGSSTKFFLSMSFYGIYINILLMLFNLLPILPLDGGRVLRGLVPESIGRRLDALERYGLIITVLLVVVLFKYGLFRPDLVVLRLMALLGVSP